MTLIDKDEADITNLDAEDLYLSGRLYDLEPFAMEEVNGSKSRTHHLTGITKY